MDFFLSYVVLMCMQGCCHSLNEVLQNLSTGHNINFYHLRYPCYGLDLQRIANELDTKTGKLCLRPVSQDDIDGLLRSDPTLNIEQPIDIQHFDEITRKLLKRIAIDRGKRLGLFILGGIMVVHFLKGTVHKIPFIGPPAGIIMNVFMPTIVVGPAVGIAGAMHL